MFASSPRVKELEPKKTNALAGVLPGSKKAAAPCAAGTTVSQFDAVPQVEKPGPIHELVEVAEKAGAARPASTAAVDSASRWARPPRPAASACARWSSEAYSNVVRIQVVLLCCSVATPAGCNEVAIELKKHQAHGIRLIGERVLPALR